MKKQRKRIIAILMAIIMTVPSTFMKVSAAEEGELTMPDVNTLLANDCVLYLVNCGSLDPTVIPTGYKLGLFQSSLVDQEYALDSGTNASWGYYQSAPNILYSRRSSTTNTDIKSGYMYNAKGTNASTYTYAKNVSGIYYNFQLPEEEHEYEVTIGVNVPSSWSSRKMDYVLEDTTVASQVTLTKGTNVEKSYTVTVSDGELNVKLHNPNRTSTDNDASVSYIIVKAKVGKLDYLKQLIQEVTLTTKQREQYSQVSLEKYDEALQYATQVAYAEDAQSFSDEKLQSYYDKLEYRYEHLMAKNTAVTYQSFAGTTAYDNYTDFAEYSGTSVSEWYDTNGNKIEAHAGDIKEFTIDGVTKYYMYGEDRTDEKRGKDVGVRVYSSTDLYNWTDEGLAFRNMTDVYDFEETYFNELYADVTEGTGTTLDEAGARYGVARESMTDEEYREKIKDAIAFQLWDDKPLERPKVLYNESTGKYVMWYHSDGPTDASPSSNYAAACAAVAVSDSPFGPFKYLGRSRLNYVSGAYSGEQGMARDMTLFKDDDGTAYIIYASEGNATLMISKLSDDYLSLSADPDEAVEGVDFVRDSCFVKKNREAPAMFKYNGKYYMLTSSTNGWATTQTRYAVADSVFGPWTDKGDACKTISGTTSYAADKTFGGQSAAVFPVDAEKGQFIFLTDRWNRSNPTTGTDVYLNPSYVWFPIEMSPDSDTVLIRPYNNWKLEDFENMGTITAQEQFYYAGEMADEIPVTITNAGGTIEKTSGVTWTTSFDSTKPGSYSLSGNLDIAVGTHKRPVTMNAVLGVSKAIYVVDVGATSETIGTDYTKMVEGSTVEVRNSSVPDQIYDETSGTSWGYVDDGNATTRSASGNLYDTLRYANDSSSSITYKFDGLEAGEYNVYVGYMDPWSSYVSNRAVDVTINGLTVASAKKITGSRTTDQYGVTMDEKGTLTLTLSRAASADSDVLLNWIVVEQVSVVPPTLESITLTPPTKTAYTSQEDLDLTGMVVTANYSDDSSMVIPNDEVIVSGYDREVEGNQTITVTYGDMEAEFIVHVTRVTISSIEVKTAPTKVTYASGDAVADLNGMVLTVHYSNGSSTDVADMSEVQASAINPEQLGTQVIIVTYQGVSTTFEIQVVSGGDDGGNEDGPTVLTGIEILQKPHKLVYTLGQNLELNGLRVQANYSDGSNQVIDDLALLTVSEFIADHYGQQIITITYEGMQDTFGVLVMQTSGGIINPPTDNKNEEPEEVPYEIITVKEPITENSNAVQTQVTTTVNENEVNIQVVVPYSELLNLMQNKGSETRVDFSIPVAATDTLAEQLVKEDVTKATAVITVDQEVLKEQSKAHLTDIVMEKELLSLLRSTCKTMTVDIQDQTGASWYTWVIDGQKLLDTNTKMEDWNLSVNLVSKEKDRVIERLLQEDQNVQAGYVLAVQENKVPSGAVLKVQVGKLLGYEEGKTLYLYHYNTKLDILDSIAKVKYIVDEEGYITVNLPYGERYVLLEKVADQSIKRTLKQQITMPETVTLSVGNTKKEAVSVPQSVVVVPNFSDTQKRRYSQEVLLAKVTYESSNKKVATVDKDGKIKGKNSGKTVIKTTIQLANGSKKVMETTVEVK
ncbi:bacterial Ig-like domain-containing protein [Anaerosporobacter faecicola]|uniref:bacterial Ig-like domain-containing protein n=1 Tax=Anaerosporobacter faecicola TaxID=2718714 RepID=UPI0014392D3C|nr:bacterial Ig-like domain-containing protein [Anaerosporobacter faecicola]